MRFKSIVCTFSIKLWQTTAASLPGTLKPMQQRVCTWTAWTLLACTGFDGWLFDVHNVFLLFFQVCFRLTIKWISVSLRQKTKPQNFRDIKISFRMEHYLHPEITIIFYLVFLIAIVKFNLNWVKNQKCVVIMQIANREFTPWKTSMHNILKVSFLLTLVLAFGFSSARIFKFKNISCTFSNRTMSNFTCAINKVNKTVASMSLLLNFTRKVYNLMVRLISLLWKLLILHFERRLNTR